MVQLLRFSGEPTGKTRCSLNPGADFLFLDLESSALKPQSFVVGRVRDPTKIDHRKKLVPYCNLSSGGPSIVVVNLALKKTVACVRGQPKKEASKLKAQSPT